MLTRILSIWKKISMGHKWSDDTGNKTEILGEKPVPLPYCPPQIPQGLARDKIQASAVTGWRLTAWVRKQHLSHKKKTVKLFIDSALLPKEPLDVVRSLMLTEIVQMSMHIEQWWNDTWRKICPNGTLPTTNPIRTGPGSDPGRRSKRFTSPLQGLTDYCCLQ